MNSETTYNKKLAKNIENVLKEIGENPQREGLLKTPERVSKSMDFLTQGYNQNPKQIIKSAIFKENCSQMVIVKDIEVYSLCEHHMLPFYGKVHVAYVPNGKIIGLSKIPRIVDVFARRLQVQERMTKEIADTLAEILDPKGVAVVAEGYHMCMMMRGVQKQNSKTLTSAMRGDFVEDRSLRDEFMWMVSSTHRALG